MWYCHLLNTERNVVFRNMYAYIQRCWSPLVRVYLSLNGSDQGQVTCLTWRSPNASMCKVYFGYSTVRGHKFTLHGSRMSCPHIIASNSIFGCNEKFIILKFVEKTGRKMHEMGAADKFWEN
jgi:hypothetical protein